MEEAIRAVGERHRELGIDGQRFVPRVERFDAAADAAQAAAQVRENLAAPFLRETVELRLVAGLAQREQRPVERLIRPVPSLRERLRFALPQIVPGIGDRVVVARPYDRRPGVDGQLRAERNGVFGTACIALLVCQIDEHAQELNGFRRGEVRDARRGE